jgi:hypothetical protein
MPAFFYLVSAPKYLVNVYPLGNLMYGVVRIRDQIIEICLVVAQVKKPLHADDVPNQTTIFRGIS